MYSLNWYMNTHYSLASQIDPTFPWTVFSLQRLFKETIVAGKYMTVCSHMYMYVIIIS